MPIDHADDPARAPIDMPRLDAGVWRLRPLVEADAAFIFEVLNDPGMQRARSAAPPADEHEAVAWVQHAIRASAGGTYAPWIVEESHGATPVGMTVLQAVDRTSLTAEAGYFVTAAGRGRGTATLALRAVTEWAFAGLHLYRVYLLHDSDNIASCRVAHKAGFQPEGKLRASRRRNDGTRCDEELHARLRDDPLPGDT